MSFRSADSERRNANPQNPAFVREMNVSGLDPTVNRARVNPGDPGGSIRSDHLDVAAASRARHQVPVLIRAAAKRCLFLGFDDHFSCPGNSSSLQGLSRKTRAAAGSWLRPEPPFGYAFLTTGESKSLGPGEIFLKDP